MDEKFEKELRRIVREELDHLLDQRLEQNIAREVQRQVARVQASAIETEIEKEVSKDEKRLQMSKNALLQHLKNIRNDLEMYVDSRLEQKYRPTIILADGRELGINFAARLSGDPGGFKRLGFTGYVEFYSNPLSKRNEFLRAALAAFTDLFGETIDESLPLETLGEKYKTLQETFARIWAGLAT